MRVDLRGNAPRSDRDSGEPGGGQAKPIFEVEPVFGRVSHEKPLSFAYLRRIAPHERDLAGEIFLYLG
jgi:hypothetical protein